MVTETKMSLKVSSSSFNFHVGIRIYIYVSKIVKHIPCVDSSMMFIGQDHRLQSFILSIKVNGV